MNGNTKNRAIVLLQVSILFRLHSFLRRSFGALLPLSVRLNAQFRPTANQAFCGLLLVFAGLLATPASATVNVYFSPGNPTLQAEFIAQTTTQYVASVTASPYFAGTYSLTITGKRNYTPPVVSSPVVDATAVDRCMTYGFVWGMEQERSDTLGLVDSLRVDISSTNTCGGYVADGSTNTSLSPFLQGCNTAYWVVHSTVSQRNGLDPKILK